MDAGALRRRLPRRARRAAARLRWAPDAAVSRASSLRAARTTALPQARGPQPHGLAQAQQRARAGAARQADGQATDHRRDRSRSARRRDGDRLRAARPRVRRLHGRRGHAPSAPERAAHGAARRDRPSRRRRREDAQGGDVGCDPRLGDERAGHALRDRLGRRAGALPVARARPAARDRRRGARAAARRRGSTARARRRVRRRWLERDRHVRGVHRRRGCRARRRRGRRRRDRHPAPRRAADGRRSRGDTARLALGRDAGRGGSDRRSALDLRRPRLSRHRPAARVPARQRPRALRRRDRRAGARRVQRLARTEGIIPALETAHALAWVLAQNDGDLDLVCLSGRGDKDLAEVLGAS